ncbi:hypothetical protein [uncultured Anaerovibrio sp.]|uniref:hypothetical protein n=1 Tax=uncultured Anaerovibrio sp. TaxID=361586 RepID=UPI00262C2E9B|nr:hypothetical protein [uncultured Anaerovibrio sp.]
MDIDEKTKKALGNLIFTAVVCEQNAVNGTVKVTREDKGNKVSNDMFVLQRGTKATKDFWIPAVGDEVLCIQAPNFSGKGTGDGFIVGAIYSSVDAPVETDPKARSVHFADGSYVRSDGAGNMEIHAAGHLEITGATIDINY